MNELSLNDYRTQANSIGIFVQKAYRDELLRNRKFATRKTYNSIDYEIEITHRQIRIVITANQSLLFIESGRRRGAKLPVKNVGGRFELVDELQEWVEAVNYTGSHYLLARGISLRGIKGVPITDMVLKRISKDIDQMFVDIFKELAVNALVRQTKRIFT